MGCGWLFGPVRGGTSLSPALGLDNSLPLAFFLGYVACEALGRYRARREKHLLAVGCLGALGSLFSLASYVMDTLPALQG